MWYKSDWKKCVFLAHQLLIRGLILIWAERRKVRVIYDQPVTVVSISLK